MQRKLQEIEDKHKIIITSGTRRIEAPLPPDFGFTVGSEYTTPFDIGSVSGKLQQLYAVGQISAPVGLRMRKMYANPEPTEISFEMEFSAFYSAKEEVVLPMVTLMIVSLGRTVKYADIEAKIQKATNLVAKGLTLMGVDGEKQIETVDEGISDGLSNPDASKYGSKALDMINLINAPEPVQVRFGNLINFRNAFITSTAVTFSNVLDKDGYPMSGKVAVTCTLQTAPVADDIVEAFMDIGKNQLGDRPEDIT